MIPRNPGTSPAVGRPGARTCAFAIVVAAALVAGAGCSQSSSSPPPTDATTTVPATTTTTPTTTTVAPTTTHAPAATSPATTAPTTEPEPEVTEPPTSTEPPVIRELVLRESGLGSASFGAEPDGVIEYVTSFLGAPTADTDWAPTDEFALCQGTEVRRVEWGVMRLSFGDASPAVSGRRHFYAWHYGVVGEVGGEPQGLRSGDGITVGSSVADLREAYPDVEIYEGDEELFPPGFEITRDFYGLLTGTGDDDSVTEMFSGYVCAG